MNGKAPFNEASVKEDPSLGRTNIFCRHLSVAILKAYQEYINDKNAEDKIAQKLTTTYQELFGDVDKITNNVGSEHDRAYYNLLFKAQENHIVGHSQLGKFSKDIFSKMEMGGRKHVLFTTGNHAMAIEYSAKKNDIGETEYAMKLYDPNNTLTHRRIVSDNLDKASNLEIIVSGNLDKVSSWEMSDFFSERDFQSYFGEASKQEQVSNFTIVPNNFFETYSKSLQAPSERKFSFDYLSPAEREDPALFFHLLSTGAPLDELERQVDLAAAEKDQKKIIKILTAENSEGWGGLSSALQFGHAETIEKWGKILEKHKHLLTDDQIAKLLAPEGKNNVPGSHMAMQIGHAESIKNWGNIVENFADRLGNDRIINLLSAKNNQGVVSLYIAMQEGHHETMKNWGEILEKNKRHLNPTDEQIIELLEAKNSDGFPGLRMAMQEKHVKIIENWVKILETQKHILSDDQITDLCAAKYKGIPALYTAMQEGNTKSIKNCVEVFEKQKPILSDDQITNLLAAKYKGTPALYTAMEKGNTEAIDCIGKLLVEQKKKGNLTTPQIVELLAARNANGTPGLSAAFQNSNEEVIESFKEILDNLELTSTERAEVLASGNPHETHGLFQALKEGETHLLKHFLGMLKGKGTESEPKPEPQKLVNLLTDHKDTPSLWTAFNDMQGEDIEVLGEILILANLPSAITANVLGAFNRDTKTPGLHQAIKEGNDSEISKLGDIIETLNLEPAHLATLLAAKDADGKLGIEADSENGKSEAAEAFREMVLAVGGPALCKALKNGDAAAILELGEIIEKSGFEPDEVKQLVDACEGAKVTAEQPEMDKAIKAFCTLLLKEADKGKLDRAHARELATAIAEQSPNKNILSSIRKESSSSQNAQGTSAQKSGERRSPSPIRRG